MIRRAIVIVVLLATLLISGCRSQDNIEDLDHKSIFDRDAMFLISLGMNKSDIDERYGTPEYDEKGLWYTYLNENLRVQYVDDTATGLAVTSNLERFSILNYSADMEESEIETIFTKELVDVSDTPYYSYRVWYDKEGSWRNITDPIIAVSIILDGSGNAESYMLFLYD